jgi:hypothetical protein
MASKWATWCGWQPDFVQREPGRSRCFHLRCRTSWQNSRLVVQCQALLLFEAGCHALARSRIMLQLPVLAFLSELPAATTLLIRG